VIGRSGGMLSEGDVDPWSHFVNAYVLDRDGKRIDRRNAQDIFLPLYNHQIPPGAASVLHYVLSVPEDATAPITFEVALRYRKFDTTYVRHFQGEDFVRNDLPIMTLAEDAVTFPLAAGEAVPARIEDSPIPPWQRWNDYGIGLLLEGDEGPNRGELRQAEQAFLQVEALGRPDGPLNLARVCLKEGRLEDARKALARAVAHDPPAAPWSVAWFSGLVDKQNGFLDEAIESFRSIVELDSQETRARGFDFSKDYRVLDELGQSLVERARQERGEEGRERREALMREALGWFERALVLDPEDLPAHYNLALIHEELGDPQAAARHLALHARYKPDDNARDRAIAAARMASAAANHAAESIVIYDLQRQGTFELPPEEARR
jgi:tetratricopeptide (TPR) repeat protein